MEENLRKIREGELKFIRSLACFEGIRVFGPFIPGSEEITENNPKVHNDKNIYENVLADLDVAVANLPEKQEQVGRVNLWAATLKAKVLIYWATSCRQTDAERNIERDRPATDWPTTWKTT